MSQEILHHHRDVWQKKPLLRRIYHEWYSWLNTHAVAGPTLEIGAGGGNYKELHADVICVDIVFVAWVDAVADAQFLPFKDNSFNTVVMIDVLHHIEQPYLFFREVARVLRPGGRLCMLEPVITPFSWVVYRLFHDERIDFGGHPWGPQATSGRKLPFEGNLACVNHLFGRGAKAFERMQCGLTREVFTRCSFLVYPLSGGFRRPPLIPERLFCIAARLERVLSPLRALLAFRALIVLRKGQTTSRYPSSPAHKGDA